MGRGKSLSKSDHTRIITYAKMQVYRGVKEAGELVEKREEWDKVDRWLSERR